MIQYKDNNLTVFQSALYMTTTAIVHTKEAIIMTDPNWLPEEVKAIREYIDEYLGNKKLYIIYTHSDFDHIIGANAFPEAYVIASEEFKKHEHKSEIISKYKILIKCIICGESMNLPIRVLITPSKMMVKYFR